MKQFISLLLLFSILIEASHAGKPNKERYTLIKENFSETESINFKGLQNHIGHQFKDETLLQEALYPLLPKALKKEEEKYNHLEFLGDAVLGTTIREYLVKRFADQERSFLVKAYELLTRNKTLTEAYLKQLSIEEYLPFPENKKCEYCNVIEALIGAIHLDDAEKGYRNAKKFVMNILNDHVIQEKISIIATEKSIALGINLLPEIKKHLAEVSKNQPIEKINPKSFLGEVLLKTWSAAPTYTLSLALNNEGDPAVEARISGIQIGKNQIKGIGYTAKEAEENVARNAINFICQEVVFPPLHPIFSKTYIAFLNGWSTTKKIPGLKITDTLKIDPTIFRYQAILNDGFLIKGEGNTKRLAKEEASKQAYHHLADADSSVDNGSRNYRTLLREWFDRNPNSIFNFEEHIIQPDTLYTTQIIINQTLISEKKGAGKAVDIRETACRDALIYLIQQQEIREKEIESRKMAGKPVDKIIPDSKTAPIASIIKADTSQPSTSSKTTPSSTPKKKQIKKSNKAKKETASLNTEKGSVKKKKA
ncbi:MAG: hypothetical protein K0M45_02005 [Candidatus Paracaedibacteraceae bacterium]|nr:hypothetical protein [Candidatus Paracaedibacteraceae bacterium]